LPEFVTFDNPSKLFLVLCTHVAVEQSFDKLPTISSDDFRGNFIIREPYDTGVVNVVIFGDSFDSVVMSTIEKMEADDIMKAVDDNQFL